MNSSPLPSRVTIDERHKWDSYQREQGWVTAILEAYVDGRLGVGAADDEDLPRDPMRRLRLLDDLETERNTRWLSHHHA